MSNEKLTARILIVDDEVTTCQYIDRHLQMEENLIATCDFAHNVEEAIGKKVLIHLMISYLLIFGCHLLMGI